MTKLALWKLVIYIDAVLHELANPNWFKLTNWIKETKVHGLVMAIFNAVSLQDQLPIGKTCHLPRTAGGVPRRNVFYHLLVTA